MKLNIFLTESMAADLLHVCKNERRYPRQQVEYLLEKALQAAVLETAVLRSIDAHQEGQFLTCSPP